MIPGFKGWKIDRSLEVAEVADLMVGMLLSWGKLEESASHHVLKMWRLQVRLEVESYIIDDARLEYVEDSG